MTLDNLQLALKLNNIILLEKIKNLQDSVASITGTDLTQLKQDIKDLNDLLEQTKEDIESLNTTTISEITQRLDDIDTTIEYIKNNITDLDKNIQDNLDSIKELTQSFTDLSKELDTHIKDTIIHVTQDDKDLWNAILDNAKKYAKELFDKVTSFKAVIVTELPTENIETMCIYLLAIDPKEKDSYEEYMYINNSWELIGNTRINLEPYILRTEVEKMLKDYLLKKDSHEHDNLDTLNEISESNGLLNYKGKPIAQEIITDEDIEQAIKDVLEILNKEES